MPGPIRSIPLFNTSIYSAVQSAELFPKIAQCHKCKLCNACTSPKMPHGGKGKRGILIVSEAPSGQEDRAGKFLFGESTQLLEGALAQHGIDYTRDCWRVNAVWCNPQNKAPKDTHVDFCRPNVIRTIQELKPKQIILLGKHAIRSVIGWSTNDPAVESMGKWLGWCIPERKSGAWVLPTFHPSAMTRENDPEAPLLRFHFRRHLARFFDGRTEQPPAFGNMPAPDSHVHIMLDPDEVIRYIESMIDVSAEAAFDYETNCLKPDYPKAKIRCMSICFDGKPPVAFPMHPRLKPTLVRFFQSPISKIAANAKFEDRWTRAMFGVKVRNWAWDTMVHAHLLDNRPGITGLKFQAFVRFGIPDYSRAVKHLLEATDGHYNRIDNIDLQTLLRYNGLDSLYEYHLADVQRREYDDTPSGMTVTPAARQLFHDGTFALSEVEANGIRVDQEYLQTKSEELQTEITNLTRELRRLPEFAKWQTRFGMKTNTGSRQQLATVLFTAKAKGGLGFAAGRKTATGRDAVDEEVLKGVGIPLTAKFLRIEKLKKARSTYLQGIAREVVNGRLHPVFNLHITQTYRSSSDSPNFQNIPVRDAEIMKLVRSAFLPSPGNCLCEVDYSGVEVRVAACYNEDPRLIEYIKNPALDMHRDMAGECFKLKPNQVDKKTRYCGKNMFVFPQFYGDWFATCATRLWDAIGKMDLHVANSKRTIRRHLERKGISELGELDEQSNPTPGSFMAHVKEVERHFWNDRFAVYTQWKRDWWDAYQDHGGFETKTGFVVFGKYRRNEVLNYAIQGSAFHCLLWSMIRLIRAMRKRKMKSKIVGQIHDSILADVHPSEVEEFLRLAYQIMVVELTAAWPWIIVPLDIEAEITKPDESWATKAPIAIPK